MIFWIGLTEYYDEIPLHAPYAIHLANHLCFVDHYCQHNYINISFIFFISRNISIKTISLIIHFLTKVKSINLHFKEILIAIFCFFGHSSNNKDNLLFIYSHSTSLTAQMILHNYIDNFRTLNAIPGNKLNRVWKAEVFVDRFNGRRSINYFIYCIEEFFTIVKDGFKSSRTFRVLSYEKRSNIYYFV